MSTLSHFPEDKYEISIYLFWDKDFIALANSEEYPDYEMYIFLISRRKHTLWVFIRSASVRHVFFKK